MHLTSLAGRQTLLLGTAALAGLLVYFAVTAWPLPVFVAWLSDALSIGIDGNALRDPLIGVLVTLAVLVPVSLWLGAFATRPLARMLRALQGGVASYRDGDFSFSIASVRHDELGELIRMHNALGRTLREQRQHLAQRELLLDTVVQNTPVALVLTGAGDKVAYANIAARHLFNNGRSLAGLEFRGVLAAVPATMRRVIAAGEDTLFSVDMDSGEETFHMSQRSFRLQGRPHRLLLFRRMTRELSRQEVATWKRVIRVISHELNNSLAPISSLAHSGAELARRGDRERLPGVFATIADRARHLHGFIDGYARFAKLPTPQLAEVAWRPFLDSLALQSRFDLVFEPPSRPGWFDAVQIEQVLINLLKNAHEAGGDHQDVTLAITRSGDRLRLEVADRGPGMSDAVLAQALLPFYSTKRDGTGLGLALVREIAEAHDGRVTLSNRDGGGLRATLWLPLRRVVDASTTGTRPQP